MQKKYTAVTIILIILVAIRFLAQSMSAFFGSNWIDVTIYLVLAAAYLGAFIGLMQKRLWGVITVAVIAVIDLVAAILVGGPGGWGAAFLDIVLLVLSFFEYRAIKGAALPRQAKRAAKRIKAKK